MEITFVKYDEYKKLFTFSLNKGCPSQLFLEKIKYRVDKQLNACLDITGSKELTISHFSSNSFIETFIADTKKLFLDNGITLENWKEFTTQSFTVCGISESKGEKKQLSMLSKDILYYISSQFISSTNTRLNFLLVDKSLHQQLDDPKKRLQVHYPVDYKILEQKEKRQDNKKKTETLFAYRDIFKWAHINYKKDLKYIASLSNQVSSPRNLTLMRLIKEGDVEAILASDITLKELWLIRDCYNKTWNSLTSWANRNKHKNILNVIYNKYLPSIKGFGLNELHWAIFCFQDMSVIQSLAQDKNRVTERFNAPLFHFLYSEDVRPERYTPLQLAAFCGHLEAVQYLISLNKDYLNLKTSDHEFSLLHLAAANNHLDIVKYLVENGANLQVICKYPSYNTVLNFSRKDVALYLIAQPDIVFDILRKDRNHKDDEYYYHKYDNEQSMPILIFQAINTWVNKNHNNVNNIFYPLISYFKKFKKQHAASSQFFNEYLVANMLISVFNKTPQDLLKQILIFEKESLDKNFFKALVEVKNKIAIDLVEMNEELRYKKRKI